MTRNRTACLAAVIALAGAACAAPAPGFTDDLDAALAEASASGRFVLVDFTGSDWCGWCRCLDKEVFATGAFLAGATNDFVLVQIDSPRDRSILSERARKANPELVRKYGIRGYPTVLLLDSSGVVMETTGYHSGGPAAYLDHLGGLLENARRIKAAEAGIAALAEGSPERARAIDALMATLDLAAQKRRERLVDEVLAADPDGSLGLRDHYGYFVHTRPAEECLSELRKKVDEAMNSLYEKELGGDPAKYRTLSEGERAEVDARLADLLATKFLPGLLAEYGPRIAAFRSASVPPDVRRRHEIVLRDLEGVLDKVRWMIETLRPPAKVVDEQAANSR